MFLSFLYDEGNFTITFIWHRAHAENLQPRSWHINLKGQALVQLVVPASYVSDFTQKIRIESQNRI